MNTKVIIDWLKANKIKVIAGAIVILALLSSCACQSDACKGNTEAACGSDVHVHDETCTH